MNITPATSIWNTTSFMTFISNVDLASGNLFITTIVIGVFLITMFIMKNFDTGTALISASFTTAVMAVLLGYAGVSAVSLVVPTVVVLVIAVLVYIIGSK